MVWYYFVWTSFMHVIGLQNKGLLKFLLDCQWDGKMECCNIILIEFMYKDMVLYYVENGML